MKRPGKLHTMVTCASCMILYASHNCEVVFADMVDVIKKITCLWNHISLAHIVNIIWQISSHSYHLTNHIVNIIWQIILSISSDKSHCQYHLTTYCRYHLTNIISQTSSDKSYCQYHLTNIIWQIRLSISSDKSHCQYHLTTYCQYHLTNIIPQISSGKSFNFEILLAHMVDILWSCRKDISWRL